MPPRRLDRVLREHGQAIAATVVVHEFAEPVLHAEGFPQRCGLIDASAAAAALVHLLQRHEIRLQPPQYGGGAVKVELAVHPHAVPDVGGDDAERGPGRHRSRVGLDAGRDASETAVAQEDRANEQDLDCVSHPPFPAHASFLPTRCREHPAPTVAKIVAMAKQATPATNTPAVVDVASNRDRPASVCPIA